MKTDPLNPTTLTDFGYEEIPVAQKTRRVMNVFDSVASQYDLMNDLMSFGLHRLWKKYTIEAAQIRPHHAVLDLAGGTGDLTQKILKKLGSKGHVCLADLNHSMLEAGRDKILDTGFYQKTSLSFLQTNAERLAFQSNYFDRIFISFGLRNVTDKMQALRSMYRVLKVGGVLLVLEFSKPVLPLLSACYDRYSFSLVPKLGELVTGSSQSYQYLVESIRKHPDQETLKNMILEAGFDQCDYFNLTGGIVCLHKAVKI